MFLKNFSMDFNGHPNFYSSYFSNGLFIYYIRISSSQQIYSNLPSSHCLAVVMVIFLFHHVSSLVGFGYFSLRIEIQKSNSSRYFVKHNVISYLVANHLIEWENYYERCCWYFCWSVFQLIVSKQDGNKKLVILRDAVMICNAA